MTASQSNQGAPDSNTAFDDDGVPENATIRSLYVDCGRCLRAHGPSLYWEERDAEGRVRTGYIGKRNLQGAAKEPERKILPFKG